jgi:hypothetical protein
VFGWRMNISLNLMNEFPEQNIPFASVTGKAFIRFLATLLLHVKNIWVNR